VSEELDPAPTGCGNWRRLGLRAAQSLVQRTHALL
jgi:hypothetical protein